jgi:hypothetical protein
VGTNIADHTLGLATGLLDDIELSQLPVEALVQKAIRLARLVEDDDVQEWLRMELGGYHNNKLGRRYMTLTGRWINEKEDQGWWDGVAQTEATLRAQESLLTTLRLPDVSGDYTLPTLRDARAHAAQVAQTIATLGSIRAKVIALLHDFVSNCFYELAFSQQQAELFDSARQQVDALLAPLSGDTLSKVDSIYRRLDEGDGEAISQALSTRRRLIDAVANAIYPPTSETVELGGNTLMLDEGKVQNRLNVHVSERSRSATRRQKLRRTLNDLYGRVSSAVHSEVTPTEARSLFLAAYLYLGEVLSLDQLTA